MSDNDPRPVFDGDWSTADGKARQAHMVEVNAWKARHGVQGPTPKAAKGRGAGQRAGSGSAAGDGQPERHADDLRDLQAVIDHAPLASDRIRAIEAKQRILARVEQEQREEAHGPLVALGTALSALPEGSRVDALSALLQVGDVRASEAQSQ